MYMYVYLYVCLYVAMYVPTHNVCTHVPVGPRVCVRDGMLVMRACMGVYVCVCLFVSARMYLRKVFPGNSYLFA